MKAIRFLTNFQRFPLSWSYAEYAGTAKIVNSLGQFLKTMADADVIIINGDVQIVLTLALVFSLCPFLRKPLIAVDLVLRKPEGWRHQISAFVKRRLLARVDYFIHYFKDLKGYQMYYGLGLNRSAYVPFKPNLQGRFNHTPNSDGDYVVCFGWSLRDYDTFFKAMAMLPYPAAMAIPNFKNLRANGARFSSSIADLPANIMLLDDDGTSASQVRILEKARLVVIPILSQSICASGIGTYLNAMWMGKCVIISEGPGVSDVLSGQALVVAPEDPMALAQAIRTAWEDPILREDIARRGQRYADLLGGEPELMNRILEQTVVWLGSSS